MLRRRLIVLVALAGLMASGAVELPAGQVSRAEAANASVVATVTSLLNAERAKRGLGALQPDSKLNRAAAAHARDMANRNYFAHQSPDGKKSRDRMRAAGYCRASTAENIAKGYRSAAKVMAGWMASRGHRKNMLNRKYIRFGISEYNGYWVMTLGGPCV
ncbi:CAP domain-containing protein [Thalassovita aquimarina]|uniref:CAP domain-containing protein n=1 Tax=Thalassovita aquimarina TaxID=2785917 RepID=A0ABS5HU45_9RHOB|nr:CAP domain-containing protein [Thalassovita aquimarina]MBR9652494.1 CAP domain-containing protein [Thalassovita aquimarina]